MDICNDLEHIQHFDESVLTIGSLDGMHRGHMEIISALIAISKSNHIPFRVVLMCDKPVKNLMNFFDKNNIETRTVFYPLHKQPCYLNHGEDSDFTNSIYAYEHGICLPSYPELEEIQVDYICDKIREYYNVQR